MSESLRGGRETAGPADQPGPPPPWTTSTRAMFDCLTDAVFLTDADGVIRDANRAGQRLFDRPREALVGLQPSDLPGLEHVSFAMVRQDVETHGMWQADLSFLLPDGRQRLSTVRVHPLVSDEHFHGFLAVDQDVTDIRAAEQALAESERLWRLTFEQSPVGIALVSLDGTKWLRINRALCRMFDCSARDLLTGRAMPVTHPDDQQRYLDLLAELLAGRREEFACEKRYLHRNGRIIWVALQAQLLRDDEGRPLHYVAQARDITQERMAAQRLAESEQRYRLLAENSSDIITQTAVDGTILYMSPSYGRILGHDPADRIGGPSGVDVVEEDLPSIRHAWRMAAGGSASRLTFRTRHANGRQVWLESNVAPIVEPTSGAVIGVETTSRDITERQAAAAELERLALTDSLTGLANRTLLLDRLRRAQERLRRAPGTTALLMIDIDRFKLINDTLGHGYGDEALTQVARRLVGCARPTDTVARPGGDEFVILLERVNRPQDATEVAQRVLEVVRAGLTLPVVGSFDLRASIGVAFTDDPDYSSDMLYREADLALYHAKDNGRDRYSVFDSRLRSRMLTQVRAEKRVRTALDTDGLQLYYQPIVSLAEPALDMLGHAEALVRLTDPDNGRLIMPDDFIGAAEETGLVCELDTWVMAHAVQALSAGRAEGIAINIAPRTMLDQRFVAQLGRALDDTGVNASRLSIEITERTLMHDTTAALEAIGRLHDLGVAIGLDDFGTGYSSLAYLRDLPLNFLKIDRSFTADVARSEQVRATVAAITQLAHSHGLTVTVEGIETAEQLEVVRRIGCDHAQGHHLGRPAPLPS